MSRFKHIQTTDMPNALITQFQERVHFSRPEFDFFKVKFTHYVHKLYLYIFDKCIYMYILHPYKDMEFFRHLRNLLVVLPSLTPLNSMKPLNRYFQHLFSLYALELHRNEIISLVLFSSNSSTCFFFLTSLLE